MQRSLEQELKDFEKDLSLLLVRFMKICDAVEHGKASAKGPAKPAAVNIAPAPKPLDLRAYV